MPEVATARAPIKRRFKVGTVDREGVFVNAEIDAAGELHITADIYRSGIMVGGGQAIDTVERVYLVGNIDKGTSYRTLTELCSIWRRWHLNHMKAGCEHQRTAGWDKLPIDPEKPTHTYGRHFDGQRSPSWNMRTWVSKSEHPLGLMSEPCWVCGYKYGTAWLKEELPDEVYTFIESLPA